MSGTWRRAEGSAEMAAPECIETGSELQEVRPLCATELPRTNPGVRELRGVERPSAGMLPPSNEGLFARP